MLLSHTKSNLIDYFGNTVGTPMEHAFHWLYLGTAGLCLAGTFAAVERAGKHGRLHRPEAARRRRASSHGSWSAIKALSWASLP